MRRSMRRGRRRDPKEHPFFFYFSHSFDSGGRTCTSLSLTHSPHFVYIYINNCLHVQCLPLNKRTSVVAVGVQVSRISADLLATPSSPLLEYIFFLKVARRKTN
uniref:Uncharacterized protein n=1 Tax=Rhipicephalus zambeziensis TaxID=60191 RepID=A0A224YHY2_9ACAR